MVSSTDIKDDDCPYVDWKHKLRPGQCVFIHTIVEAPLYPKIKVDPYYEDSKNVRIVRMKENCVVHSDNVVIEDGAGLLFPQLQEDLTRITSATPAPANAANSAIHQLEQCRPSGFPGVRLSPGFTLHTAYLSD